MLRASTPWLAVLGGNVYSQTPFTGQVATAATVARALLIAREKFHMIRTEAPPLELRRARNSDEQSGSQAEGCKPYPTLATVTSSLTGWERFAG